MAKAQKYYICQQCGTSALKWSGKCEGCGAWNALAEEAPVAALPKGLGSPRRGASGGERLDIRAMNDTSIETPPRLLSGIDEFDRALGGGLVPGSATLIGGDPGIGKSTLLLQLVTMLAAKGRRCLYVSGEEATSQIRLRAQRLGTAVGGDGTLDLAAATSVRAVAGTIEGDGPAYDLLVIDSIQTMFIDTIDSAPGTVAQVRTCAQELIRMAKKGNMAVILVGHVTKDGQIAGPRVLEHMVDTVLYFEGDRGQQCRILRSVKNRFGGTDEIGVFEMTDKGLEQVTNPSALFLSERASGVPGSAVLAGLEGTRPVLVEVQALVATTGYGTPRRSALGYDANRLAMILAVLETRAGLPFSSHDVFLNMAGGLKITETAADLAVAAALVSALQNRILPADTVFFGEIGLGGEVRPVPQPDMRLKEAAKLGFAQALLPPRKKAATPALSARDISHIQGLTDWITDHAARDQRLAATTGRT